ncbi:MAG: NAD(+) diphosphatase [Tessaracoccus sp.]|uniref:NAD(+) diphosphatase n=1 Tax=Tessaracoccus sp. TaxID=1971211 RepID=UPI001EC6E373|nr:NAD(+) diphosphatase [Tessaracoccus sp.]MBK7820345.1 NAD(+) diphosphatase [Tessaracoccus sp.]
MTTWTGPSGLDRLATARSDAEADAAWREALVVEIDGDGGIAAADGAPRVVPASGERLPTDILLGRVAGRPWFARPVAALNGAALGWRDVVTTDQDALAAAVALTRWHGLSPSCEACGAATVSDLAGARRRCVSCGALAFPRTDPCVIVAITDPGDRLLLARQSQWAERRVSIIAGFIEAGESAEQACHREAFEEVGVRLTGVTYAGSQPWPMPRSLMLGFLGRAEDSRIRVDGDEIAEGAYYAREELVAAVAAASVVLPPHASIARGLIERWLSAR